MAAIPGRPEIHNPNGQRIDTWVEGNSDAETTVILVHGFGTDKHETAGFFDDIARALGQRHRIVRFDFAGCGVSGGRFEDMDYSTQADDLRSVISFVRGTYGGTAYVLAQSMGTFVTSLLCPDGIDRTVFTGIPNADTGYLIDRLVARMGSRSGAAIDLSGISVFPRSSGALQKIGPSFWNVLRSFDPVRAVTAYAGKTRLLIIHPKRDDVVGNEHLEPYAGIPGTDIRYLDGNHSFTDPPQRQELIRVITDFFA